MYEDDGSVRPAQPSFYETIPSCPPHRHSPQRRPFPCNFPPRRPGKISCHTCPCRSVDPNTHSAISGSAISLIWVLYAGMQWKCFPVRKDRDGTATIHELAASFQESRRGIPWLWWRPRVADEGAVRKRRGTLGQRVRHNAQNRCPCARVLQRCPGDLCIHVLLILHEVSPVSKPCNPFTGSAHRKAFPRAGCRLDHGWRR